MVMENMRARSRGRRGRGRGRGSAAVGRRKKSVEQKDESLTEEEEAQPLPAPVPVLETHNLSQLPPPLDMEADISQLEAPTFTTISRGPPEPMLRLQWGHRVNLQGEKVLNPLIHCCDTCLRPVLIYGRMIPCKHVFCLTCAKRDSKLCSRCSEKVIRVEQTGLGTVFMCTHGGSRYGNSGCRRTYLSQRDLQVCSGVSKAHINHRHVSGSMPLINPIPVQCNKIIDKSASVASVAPFYEAPKVKLYEESDVGYVPSRVSSEVPPPPPPGQPPMRLPAPRSGNLITVPIQEPLTEPYFNAYNPPPVVSHVPPPVSHVPPTAQAPYYNTYDYPPPHDTSVPPPNQWPGNAPFYG